MDTAIIQQYQDAISKGLTPAQIEFLQVLYSFPESKASPKELAKIFNYSTISPVNGRIGKIGKVMAAYAIDHPWAKKILRVKRWYFGLVGPWYKKERKWGMWEELRAALENMDLVEREEKIKAGLERLPTEVPPYDEEKLYIEGKVIRIYVNRYERNLMARLKCISHFGTKCYACSFDFGKVYGDIANGFIHVHHKKPINEIGKEYEVDAVNDLVPLCANCHSVIHLAKPILTVEELKNLIIKNQSVIV